MPVVKDIQIIKEDKAKLKLALLEASVRQVLNEQLDIEKISKALTEEIKLFRKLFDLTKQSLASTSAKADSLTKFLSDISQKQISYLQKLQDTKLSTEERVKNAEMLKTVNGLFMSYAKTITKIPQMLISIKDFEQIAKDEIKAGGKKTFEELFPNDKEKFRENIANSFNNESLEKVKEAGLEVDFSKISEDLIKIPIVSFNDITGQSRKSFASIEQSTEKTSAELEDEEDIEELTDEEKAVINNLFKFLEKNSKNPANIEKFLDRLKQAGIDVNELNKLIQT